MFTAGNIFWNHTRLSAKAGSKDVLATLLATRGVKRALWQCTEILFLFLDSASLQQACFRRNLYLFMVVSLPLLHSSSCSTPIFVYNWLSVSNPFFFSNALRCSDKSRGKTFYDELDLVTMKSSSRNSVEWAFWFFFAGMDFFIKPSTLLVICETS